MFNIQFDTKGIEGAQAFVKNLPFMQQQAASQALAEYLVGDMTHGLMHYPPYNYVSINRAYGGFVSDAQRRFVMASIAEGRIEPGYPHRTGRFQRGWIVRPIGGGAVQIVNATPYGPYLVGNDNMSPSQANMMRLIGWRQIRQNEADNMAGAQRHAVAVINAQTRVASG